jgi:arsenate reductase
MSNKNNFVDFVIMSDKIKILILCTGNSCRSQMAEAFLKQIDSQLEVFSAGTQPAERVNPFTVRVMQEVGLDLSGNKTKSVEQFLDQDFDFVITVCGGAKETCPVFFGKVKQRLHIGFDDPADATGSEAEILAVYRRVRDEIRAAFRQFYEDYIRNYQNQSTSK